MKEKSIGIIPYLIDDSGVSILLMKSSPNVIQYDFVKGKIEIGETFKECCLREVKEEIGISILEEDLENFIEQLNKRKNIRLYYINWDKYIKTPFVLDNREVYRVEWFNLNRMPEVSKNQRLILTDINLRFNKLNYLNQRRENV